MNDAHDVNIQHNLPCAQDMTKAAWLDLLARHAPAVLWLADGDGTLRFVSDKWFQYSGLTLDQTPFRWTQVVHPDDCGTCLEKWRISIAEPREVELAVRLRRAADQKYLWHIIRAVPIFEGKNKCSWAGVIIDINDQKNSEQLLQIVIDSIPGGIFWKDLEGRYLGCNQTNAAKAGFRSPAELIGRTDYETSWSEQADFYRTCDKKVAETKKPLVNIIEPITSADGTTGWIETNKVPLFDADGNVVGTVGNYVDISDRLALIQQREDFMASLAHDLKVPIVGAIRALEALHEGALGMLTDEQRAFVSKMQVSHQQLLTIIQNVLQVLRYEASPDELQVADCDLSSAIHATINDVTPIFESKRIELINSFPDRVPARADSLAIRRILLNLLGNAAKFTPPGGKVCLDVSFDEYEVVFSVSDSGIGISAEDQARLFKRFWQGGTVKRYAAETGLGLYLCRQIAEGHGGSISVSSDIGDGACFVVRIPRDGPPQKVDMRFIEN